MTRKYGVASPSELVNKTGKEILQAIIDSELPQAAMSKVLNFWLVEVGDGIAVFEGEPSAEYLNPMGSVHGGWALTLLDSATACAANSVLPAGVGYTTIETKGNCVRAIKPDTGRVRSEAKVINQGRQIITAEARIIDRNGVILAHGVSTMMVLAPRG